MSSVIAYRNAKILFRSTKGGIFVKYKRMISAALCFSMAVSAAMAVPSVNAARYSMAEEVIDGDVNYDGVFNIADLVTFRKWIMNGSDYIRKEAADLNKDGKINAFDYALMRKMVAASVC